MRIISAIILFLYSSLLLSQVENGCININFETLPFQVPTEGLTIRNQFETSFGLTFELENGSFPVLAEVGGVTTAFGSAYGNDTPAPGADMGRFFLTDDGQLSGLFSPPLILRFQVPIDSFAGCIVDIDLGEEFIIQALDEFDNIILADTIVDGDPGTGDGELSCWGFNLPGCEGSIHAIRYEGFREMEGAFGLGLDSFSFCYTGLHIDVGIEDPTCINNGAIDITNSRIETYEYSLDGINYTPNGYFEDLPPDLYRVFVIDSEGCETFVDILVEPPETSTVVISDAETYCAEDNGMATIFLDPEIGATYSLDGVNYQEENLFTDLAPDTYQVTIIDDNDCIYFSDFIIDPSTTPIITAMIEEDDICSANNGSIDVSVDGGSGVLEFSLDGVNFSPGNIITGLGEGDYMIYVRDEENCIDSSSFVIESTPAVITSSAELTYPDCFDPAANIYISASGGTGELRYSLDGIVFQADTIFQQIPEGNYDVLVIDELGCESITSIFVDPPQTSDVIISEFDTYCNENNGEVTIVLEPFLEAGFSMDGLNYQDENVFRNLSPGAYSVTIVDENDCIYVEEFDIAPSVAPVISAYNEKTDVCSVGSGSVEIIASGGNGILEYSIDGLNYTADNFIENIFVGNYTIYVKDEENCIDSLPIIIPGTPVINIQDIDVTIPTCFQTDGTLEIIATGGTGTLFYSLDGISFQSDSLIADLPFGEYEVFIVDDLGCENYQLINIEMPLCPIYIPNVFSPNGDGREEYFKAATHPSYDVGIIEYRIYDRWGELVFISGQYSIHTGDKQYWWDGYFNGAPANIGVYTYMIEVEHPNGTQELYANDVTLLR